MNLEPATSVLSSLTDLTKHISMKALIYSFYWLILSAKSGIGWFSGSIFSKNWIHPGWFFWIKSGSYLKFGTVDSPNVCFEKAMMLSHDFSSINENWLPCGLGLAVLISSPAPDLRNMPTSPEVSFLAVIKILKQIMSMKVILSFSNKPRLMYLWTFLVMTWMMN